jgi:cytoskeletal protein CcmA (bactofilin family)
VRGNISTPSLFIEKGVVFDGQCQMEQNGVGASKARASASSSSSSSSSSELSVD